MSQDWKKNIKWDVTHFQALLMVEDGTFFFDPELSYETTGYRPITETKGLDFNPVPFREVGMTQVNTGSYTDMHFGTRKHREWWEEQHKRSTDGFVHNNYRITGDNYFFLNFYSMLVAKEGQKAGSGRNFVHPNFWAVHYEWFHYIELAEILGYDGVGLKSRGVGFSEVGASLGVRPFVTTPWFHTMYLASYEPFLTGKGIIQKCWVQLDWLNQNTEGGMRRVRQVVNQGLHRRASKQNKQGEEFGHMAQISGQVVDKADKLRGDRAERVIFEESGSNPILLDTFAVSQALVIINGVRLGTRIIFGTGGDTGPGLHGLEKMFLKPRTYGILPYKHKYNKSGHYVETGYFLPAWRTVMGAMDSRGVASEEKGKAYYNKTRNNLQNDPESYLRHCAEYCFTYEEALSQKGQNRFNQVKLANQRLDIEVHETTPKPKRGHLMWQYVPNTNEISGVKFVEHPQGTVEVSEEPTLDEKGNRIRDLYVAGIDSIDVGSNESIVGEDGSKFCITVKKRTFGLDGNKYVCKYLDRPKDVREAYEKARMILYWYGCKANIEATRVGLIAYFREKNCINMLMKRPRYAIEGQYQNKEASGLYGTQASPKMIEYGIDLVAAFIEDFCHNMYFLDMVEQCQNYSSEMKGLYDIIAAMQMTEIADQDMMGIVPKQEEVADDWEDFGYWKDSNGRLHYGVIPKQDDYGRQLFPNR